MKSGPGRTLLWLAMLALLVVSVAPHAHHHELDAQEGVCVLCHAPDAALVVASVAADPAPLSVRSSRLCAPTPPPQVVLGGLGARAPPA